MAINLANVNGTGSGKSIAELLGGTEPVQQLPELSPGSIAPLEEIAATLLSGKGDDKVYGALGFFIRLYDKKFYVPNMQKYKAALRYHRRYYEEKQSLAN